MRVSCGGPEPKKASASVIQLAKVQRGDEVLVLVKLRFA